MIRDFRLPSRYKWDLRFPGNLRRVDWHPRCVKSEKCAVQHVKSLILSILAHCTSCDIALIVLRYAQLCVFRLLLIWAVLPYNLIGRYRYHELNKDCQPRRTVRFKIPTPFSNPMTINLLTANFKCGRLPRIIESCKTETSKSGRYRRGKIMDRSCQYCCCTCIITPELQNMSKLS